MNITKFFLTNFRFNFNLESLFSKKICIDSIDLFSELAQSVNKVHILWRCPSSNQELTSN